MTNRPGLETTTVVSKTQRVPKAEDLAPPAPALLVAPVPPPEDLEAVDDKWFGFLADGEPHVNADFVVFVLDCSSSPEHAWSATCPVLPFPRPKPGQIILCNAQRSVTAPERPTHTLPFDVLEVSEVNAVPLSCLQRVPRRRMTATARRGRPSWARQTPCRSARPLPRRSRRARHPAAAASAVVLEGES